MSSTFPRRTLAILTLAALVCLPSLTLAAPLGHSPAATRSALTGQGVFARIWSFLQSFWGEAGMMIDPNGSHAIKATPGGTHISHLSGKEGMSIDPNGSH
jgi:hypothetical protein